MSFARSTRRRFPSLAAPAGHRPSLEVLEPRTLLAVTASPLDAGKMVESARDPITIDTVHLRVGDQDYSLTERNSLVSFDPLDELTVTGIDYAVNEGGGGLEGVIAFEGFLRQSNPSSYLGEFDYANGRFGAPANTDPFELGPLSHAGLGSAWTLSEDINRLSVAMVRYYGDEFRVEDRFFVNFQAERPDVVMEKGKFELKGVNREAHFYGQLKNKGQHAVATYSEVNVFLASQLSVPVWVGTLSATMAKGKKSELLEYTNTNPTDGYSERWVPAAKGRYVVMYFADPENSLAERHENNNLRVAKFAVK